MILRYPYREHSIDELAMFYGLPKEIIELRLRN